MLRYLLAILGFGLAVSGCGTAATAANDDALSADASGDVGPDCAPTGTDWQAACGPVGSAHSVDGFHANPDPVAIQTFPDDWYAVADPTSKTGMRVRFDADNAPWIATTPGAFASTYTDLSTLDGWGVNAGIILRFGTKVMDLPARVTAVDAVPIALWDLDATPPLKIPFEVQVVDNGTTLILWPMKTLVTKHLHGVIASDKLTAADGVGCLAPDQALWPLIAPTPPACPVEQVARLRPAYQRLMTAAGLAPNVVTAAVVFTTQSTYEESLAIAADIAKRNIDWSVTPVCQVMSGYRQCDGKFSLTDYTDGRVVKDIAKAHISGDLDVRIWLPLASTATTPPVYPPVIFGHGLGSDRTQGSDLADRAAPEGIATVAIDAVGHGNHPGHDPNQSKIPSILAFFGVDIDSLSIDALALRDHWRGSTYDKLQLIRLLQQHNDIDGDGIGDFNMAQLTYLGVSLGGIMGPELLAVSPDIHLSILAVPGGRISSIISDGSIFSVVATIMENSLNVTDSDVARFYPVLQSLVDRGDSASYGPFILRDRLPGAGTRGTSVLSQMVINDQYVPNAANRALIRAMDIPIMGEILQEVGVVGVAPPAPFHENIAPGVTAAVLQFDRITKNPGDAPVVAEHGDEPASQEALLQDLHFMHSWLDSGAKDPGGIGVAEIINPYDVLGTPKLPQTQP